MIAAFPVSGFSDEARWIATAASAERNRLRQSAALGNQQLFNELGNVWEECRHPNWDGHGALPVSSDVLRQGYSLLEALPEGIPVPSIGAEPDGQLTLDWHCAPRRTLSVSVSPDGDLHYAALIGPNREYGTEAFFGEFPRRIATLIQRVYRR